MDPRYSSPSAALVLLPVIHNQLQHQQSSTPVLDAQAPSIPNPGLGLGLGPYLFTGPMAGETRTPVPAGTEDRVKHSLLFTDPGTVKELPF